MFFCFVFKGPIFSCWEDRNIKTITLVIYGQFFFFLGKCRLPSTTYEKEWETAKSQVVAERIHPELSHRWKLKFISDFHDFVNPLLFPTLISVWSQSGHGFGIMRWKSIFVIYANYKCKETNLTNSGPFIQQFQHTHLQKEMGVGRRPRYDFGGNWLSSRNKFYF